MSLEVAPHRSPKPMGSKCKEECRNKRIERIWLGPTPSLYKLVFDLMHFRNLLLLFIHRFHSTYGSWVTSASLLYTLLSNPNARSTGNPEKMQKLQEILKRIEGTEMRRFLDKAKKLKENIGCKFVRQIIRQISNDFSNYFKSKKEYKEHPEKFTGLPRPPRAKKIRNYRKFTIEMTKDMFDVRGREIVLKLPGDELVVVMSKEFKVTSIRLCYYLDCFYVDIVYEDIVKPLKPWNSHIAAIDLNLDNFIALVSTNPAIPSIVIDGRKIKAFNQWFNKRRSLYQSQHDRVVNEIKRLKERGDDVPEELITRERELRRRLRMLWVYRNKRIHDWFHKLSRWLSEYLYRTGHALLIVGRGVLDAKRNCAIGRATEGFVQIPYRTFIDMLRYKCKQFGIEVRLADEKYTSKACCLNDNIVELQNAEKPKFTGVRIERGLYKTRNPNGGELLVNADCNAAFNILKVGIGTNVELTEIFKPSVLRWKLSSPIRLRLQEIPRFVRGKL